MREPEQVVYRQLAIPVSVFDRIKAVQRRHEAQHGQHLTLVGVVSNIVREHLSNEEREAHEQNRQSAAVLRR